ncbi:MAG: DUF1272 domain-containing protein [Hyphomicrobiaceae bacterium]|nr:DUF1272 domain-containing protein [Hyphomicrobiaceae bacterium]
MLVLWPNCQLCGCDLPPDSGEALICSMECTYCRSCNAATLHDVCPNCGGNLESRPIRPKLEYRPGEGLAHNPAGTQRKMTRYSAEEIIGLSARLSGIAPKDR